MNQNMGRLVRYFLILQKLNGLDKFVPGDELIAFLNGQMKNRGFEVGISLRTIQRDIREIASMFDVEIRNKRGRGYYIEYRLENAAIRYEEILKNFDLLTALSPSTSVSEFILPEHHRPTGSDNLFPLIEAIKGNAIIAFKYRLVRNDNEIIDKRVKPYFLKESLGLWYVVGFDEKERLRVFALDRISELTITESHFKRDDSIKADDMFKHSYGIWDDPAMPVEEVELSYTPLDGSFLKALPLHTSQQILIDNEEEFRIHLNIKITNDFVMALLARSNSIEVIKPLHLRDRIRKVYESALLRNHMPNDS